MASNAGSQVSNPDKLEQKKSLLNTRALIIMVVRIFLSNTYFMQLLICLRLATHLETVCVTCSLKRKVESITPKSLAGGSDNNS